MSEREIYENDQWRPYEPPPVQPPAASAPQPQSAYDRFHTNWNGGVAPPPPSGRYDFNGGSPVNEPLKAGNGWEWRGPQAPEWDNSNGQWNYGSWNQVTGSGIGFVDNTPPPPPPPPPGEGGGSSRPSGGNGAVPSLGAANIPSATLPSSVQSVFDKPAQTTPVQSAYQTALLDYMKRGQETPSLSDPTLAPQAEVFRVQQQRNQEKNRRFAAERAAAGGQSRSGYLDHVIGEGIAKQGFNTATFNAGLLGGEADKRRQELLAALHLAQVSGDNESARELQQRLAQVSAMMQQQGLNLQGQLGFGDLNLRALLGDMGNNQFYDALGVNTALGMEGLNQRALQIIMGGNG